MPRISQAKLAVEKARYEATSEEFARMVAKLKTKIAEMYESGNPRWREWSFALDYLQENQNGK